MRPLPSWHLIPPPTMASSGLRHWQALGWLLVLLLACATVVAAVNVALSWHPGGMRTFIFHARRGLALMAVTIAAPLLFTWGLVRPARRCGCGHTRGAHWHYRDGSDCGLCACARWQQEHRLHLTRAERDSRRRLGVPAGHPEHVACGPPDSLAALQHELWPESQWTEVIEDFWRERGWRG